MPAGLLVCRAVAADLQERLHKYAEVSKSWHSRSTRRLAACVCGSELLVHSLPCTPLHNPWRPQGQKLSLGGLTAGGLVSSVGRWLDRGLNAMLGGPDAGGACRAQRGLLAWALGDCQRCWLAARVLPAAEPRPLPGAGPDAGGVRSGHHSRNPSTTSLDGSRVRSRHRLVAAVDSQPDGGLAQLAAPLTHHARCSHPSTLLEQVSAADGAAAAAADSKGGGLFKRVSSIKNILGGAK